MDVLKLYEKFLITPIEKEIKILRHNINSEKNYYIKSLNQKYIDELENLLISYYKKYYEKSNDY